jgi:hypothetical protein
MKRLTPEKRRELQALLKSAYDAVLAEDHSSFHDKLRKLK